MDRRGCASAKCLGERHGRYDHRRHRSLRR
jgi:hypothetical protein